MIAEASGTQLASINTEHTLATLTAARTYVLWVSLVNMLSGDTLELRIKTKMASSSAYETVYKDSWTGAQSVDDIQKVSIPVPSDIATLFTLKQTAGTGRNFAWKIISL